MLHGQTLLASEYMESDQSDHDADDVNDDESNGGTDMSWDRLMDTTPAAAASVAVNDGQKPSMLAETTSHVDDTRRVLDEDAEVHDWRTETSGVGVPSDNAILPPSEVREKPIVLSMLRDAEVDAYESSTINVPCGKHAGAHLLLGDAKYRLEPFEVKHYTFEIHLYIDDDEEISDHLQQTVTPPPVALATSLLEPRSDVGESRPRDDQLVHSFNDDVHHGDENHARMDDVIVEDDVSASRHSHYVIMESSSPSLQLRPTTFYVSSVRGVRRLSQLEVLIRQQIAGGAPPTAHDPRHVSPNSKSPTKPRVQGPSSATDSSPSVYRHNLDPATVSDVDGDVDLMSPPRQSSTPVLPRSRSIDSAAHSMSAADDRPDVDNSLRVGGKDNDNSLTSDRTAPLTLRTSSLIPSSSPSRSRYLDDGNRQICNYVTTSKREVLNVEDDYKFDWRKSPDKPAPTESEENRLRQLLTRDRELLKLNLEPQSSSVQSCDTTPTIDADDSQVALRSRLGEMENHLEDALTKNKTMSTKLLNTQRMLASSQRDNDALRHRHQQAAEEITLLRDQVKSLRERCSEVGDWRSMHAELQQLRDELSTLRYDNEQLQIENRRLVERLNNCSMQLTETNGYIRRPSNEHIIQYRSASDIRSVEPKWNESLQSSHSPSVSTMPCTVSVDRQSRSLSRDMLPQRRHDVREWVCRTPDHYEPPQDGYARLPQRYVDDYPTCTASSRLSPGCCQPPDDRHEVTRQYDGVLQSQHRRTSASDSGPADSQTDNQPEQRRQPENTRGQEYLLPDNAAGVFNEQRTISSRIGTARRLSISSTSTECILMEADRMLDIARLGYTPRTTEDADNYRSSSTDGRLCQAKFSVQPEMRSTQSDKPESLNSSLKEKKSVSNTCSKRPFAPRGPSDINVGDIVKFSRHGGKISKGLVKFVGHLPGKKDVYLGLELEHEIGKHDGVFDGQRIFHCAPNKGVFVAFCKVIMAWRDWS